MRASREQALDACDKADLAARRAGTPIRTLAARAHLDTVWTTILQIEMEIRKVQAQELSGTGGRKVPTVNFSRSSQAQVFATRDTDQTPDELALTDDDPAGILTIDGIKALLAKKDYVAAGQAIAQWAWFHGTDSHGVLKRLIGNANLLDELALGIESWPAANQKAFIKLAASMIDPSKTSLDTVANLVKIFAADPAVLKAMYASDDFCRDLRDFARNSPLSDLATCFSPKNLGVVLAAIVQLENLEITEKDFAAIVNVLDAIASKTVGNPVAAAEVLEALGAKNMGILLSNIAQRLVVSDRPAPQRELEFSLRAWTQFSLLARNAASLEAYRNTDHELQKFMKDSDFRLSAMLLEPRIPSPSSEFVALVAARVLPDYAAMSIITYRNGTSETSRERVLAAFEADQKVGGNAVELFLFEHPRISFWGSDLQRQNTLLTTHTINSLGSFPDQRGDKDGSRSANLYLAAAIARYATDPSDVMRSFAVAAEGRSGHSLSDEGKFTLAHVLSMLLSDPKTALRFDEFTKSSGLGETFGGMDFENFKSLIGELSDSNLGTAELMIAIGRYLNARGASDLNDVQGAQIAGNSVGHIVDAIRDHAREQAQKSQEMMELLIGVGLVIGVAALGPVAVASVAATGVAGKIFAGATVEAAKNLAKQVGTVSSKQSAKLASLTEIRGYMQVVFTVNLFPALPQSVREALQADPTVGPFIVDGKLRFPSPNEEIIVNGKALKGPELLDAFVKAVPKKAGTPFSVFKFGSEFINALQGE
jgi:hypothetical protein